ncbi:metallophosphoesterase family protein [Candidatus Nitrosotenuis chungbukensis]|uniref:metallophosphoesterase family protein n=1 Tax=Candidatus Nitrosotenuis chungbukensis TaxID=1353246 RepID=UPI0006932DD3|nr:metallophosphoesterase family protein [Candidatus Nitrosotenuis chungbukensis]
MDLVFSDIHADMDGLETILKIALSPEFEEKYGKISRIINLGDLLERGTGPKEVLQKIQGLSKTYPVISVMGNHDESVLYKKSISGSSFASARAHELLSEQDLEFFHQNKDGTFGEQQIIDAKNKLLCVHGGPLDPKKITKEGGDPWLYQKTWQRLSEENNEFYSYYGYHYRASSAFEEGKTKLENFIILCGHQHIEAAIRQNQNEITNIWPFQPVTEKIESFVVHKREFEIDKTSNYLFRVGLGGPQGHHSGGFAKPHFGVIQHDPKKVILFGLE